MVRRQLYSTITNVAAHVREKFNSNDRGDVGEMKTVTEMSDVQPRVDVRR